MAAMATHGRPWSLRLYRIRNRTPAPRADTVQGGTFAPGPLPANPATRKSRNASTLAVGARGRRRSRTSTRPTSRPAPRAGGSGARSFWTERRRIRLRSEPARKRVGDRQPFGVRLVKRMPDPHFNLDTDPFSLGGPPTTLGGCGRFHQPRSCSLGNRRLCTQVNVGTSIQ